jgi:hypothetical protein
MVRLLLVGGVAFAAAVVRPTAAAAPATPSSVGQVRCEAGIAMLSENDSTYSDMEVEVLAKPRRGNAEPRFPSILIGSAAYDLSFKDRVGGEVVARFVVDTLGCVDTRTFTVVSASDSAFTQEILRVLPKYRHHAAKKDGKKVRAWLTWRFLFYKDSGPRPPF